jgi:succinate-semialdehyde dehydrogenase/glutarate-semialdehyde dehydrogenase
MPYQSTNPATGEVLKTFKELTEPQLENALKTAAACFASWRSTSFTQRAAVASAAADILRQRVDEKSSTTRASKAWR